MVTNRTPLRARRRRLSIEETDNLLVGLYPYAFRNDDERRAAWQLRRDHLITYSGTRPHAWWCYQVTQARHHVSRRSRLRERSAVRSPVVLMPFEVAQRMEWWKYHFDAAQGPGSATTLAMLGCVVRRRGARNTGGPEYRIA